MSEWKEVLTQFASHGDEFYYKGIQAKADPLDEIKHLEIDGERMLYRFPNGTLLLGYKILDNRNSGEESGE